MLITVDTGNTSTVIGIFEADKLYASWRVSTDRRRMADEYAALLHDLFLLDDVHHIDRAIISSVVPPCGRELAKALKRYWQVDSLQISSDVLRPILTVATDNPREVGADRMVNAVAALEYEAEAFIIVDFGTATNFDLVVKPQHLLGVALAPGPMTAADALFDKAAKLPRVDLEAPAFAVGKNTVTALQSGLVFGYASMVDGMVARMSKEIPGGHKPLVIATGGFASVLEGHCDSVDVFAPQLTLTGLRLIAEKLL